MALVSATLLPAPPQAIGSYRGPARDIATLAPIIGETCSQCHLAPSPSILPKKSWPDILNLMLDFANRDLLKRFDRPIVGVRFDELVNYFTTLAPDDLDAKPWGPAASPSSNIQI